MGRASGAKRDRAAVTYWHGGYPGLEVGAMLLPPSRNAIADALRPVPDRERRVWSGSRSKVYVTTERPLAEAYAIQMTDSGLSVGWLYRVAPSGRVEHDDDFPPGVSMTANSARVLEIVERDFTWATPRDGNRLAAPYQGWDDHLPVYSATGGMLPNAHLQALGVTSDYLKARFGLWPDVDSVLQILQEELSGTVTPTEFAAKLAAARSARREQRP